MDNLSPIPVMPSDRKYEVDYGRSHENSHYEIIAILTGLDFETIAAAAPQRDVWYPAMYVNTFTALGFNTDDRFIKFRPDTDKPCMMRFTDKNTKGNYWHAFAYYNDKVYLGGGEWYRFGPFIEVNPNIRVTSMLRVWI